MLAGAHAAAATGSPRSDDGGEEGGMLTGAHAAAATGGAACANSDILRRCEGTGMRGVAGV